jgi:hypothetical protein
MREEKRLVRMKPDWLNTGMKPSWMKTGNDSTDSTINGTIVQCMRAQLSNWDLRAVRLLRTKQILFRVQMTRWLELWSRVSSVTQVFLSNLIAGCCKTRVLPVRPWPCLWPLPAAAGRFVHSLLEERPPAVWSCQPLRHSLCQPGININYSHKKKCKRIPLILK